MYDSFELRLFGNMIALVLYAFFRWLSSGFSRHYLEIQIKDQHDVLKEYERRQRAISYCAIAMVVTIFLPIYLPTALLSELEKGIVAFMGFTVCFVLQSFRIWEGLNFLISKGVKVSRFGKWVVMGGEILASGVMLLYYFLLFGAYAREGKL